MNYILKEWKIINEGIELYYKEKNENGTIRRLQTIEWIETLRGGIYRIIHKIFQKNYFNKWSKNLWRTQWYYFFNWNNKWRIFEINNNGTKIVGYIKIFLNIMKTIHFILMMSNQLYQFITTHL